MARREQSATASEDGRCFTVVDRAVEMFPGRLGPLQEKLTNFFLSGRKMTPESLTDIQPAYWRFEPSSWHPLIYTSGAVERKRAGESGIMIAFLGPSASGKDSILDRVEILAPGLIGRLISTTTRPPDVKRGEVEARPPRYHHVSESLFSDLVADDVFIEYVPKGVHGAVVRYGTTPESVLEILDQEEPVKVWRGDLNGLPLIRRWMADHSPQVPFVSFFILPTMTMGQYCQKLEERRGADVALHYRFPLALKEIHEAAELVDCLVLNPPDPTQLPREAAEATLLAFEHLIS